jgi:putative transposase
VLSAIGFDWDVRRQILAVEMANRERRSSWKDFLLTLRRRGLQGVEFVVADDHAGLRASIREVLPEAAFQRCYVHLPHAAPSSTCRARPTTIACGTLALRPALGRGSPPRSFQPGSPTGAPATQKLVAWVEENIEETLTSYRLRLQHHCHLKSTNMLKRLNEEIRRRTYVLRIFPNSHLPPPHPSPRRRNPRELARSPPIPQHERSRGA